MKFFKRINCHPFFESENFLNHNEIEYILKNKTNTIDSLVIKNNFNNEVEKRIRNSRTSNLIIDEHNLKIINKVNCLVDEINNTHWRFNIDCLMESSIVSYTKKNDNYTWHMDWGPDPISCNRKLSVIVQLSDDSEYSGCRLHIKIGQYMNHYFSSKKGSIIIFPSFLMHRATKLISGERHVMVLWYHGDSFY